MIIFAFLYHRQMGESCTTPLFPNRAKLALFGARAFGLANPLLVSRGLRARTALAGSTAWRTQVKPVNEADRLDQWVDSRRLHVLASTTPHELPPMLTNRSDPIECRLVVYAKARQGRRSPNKRRQDRTSRSTASKKASAREREPWLIVASPELEAPSARRLVNLYARRMQIELGFRDLKSHRYGQGMEDSLTRHGARLQMLLLVSTLASFVSWLPGLGCEATGVAHWLQSRRIRKLYSTMRIGREALVRRWPLEAVSRWLERVRALPSNVVDQMVLAPSKRGKP